MTRAAPARPSASIILVRDAPRGLECFMVRRHARSPVAPSAYVFPGGTVRDDDSAFVIPDSAQLADQLSARSDAPVEPHASASYYVCAVRELFEEAGVLLARGADGHLLAIDEADVALQEQLAAARLSLQAGQLTLEQLLRERGWQADFDLLVPFSHWVTPAAIAARFDARFFVAKMPARQEALHCTIETSEGVWLRPSDVLDGDYHVVYATAQHLRRIAPYERVADLLGFARTKPIRRVQPVVTEGPNGLSVHLDDELIDNW